MITQLNPAMPLITSKGRGVCHFLIDYGIEHDLYWVVFLDETGECWTFSNKEIIADINQTLGRPYHDENEREEKGKKTFRRNAR